MDAPGRAARPARDPVLRALAVGAAVTVGATLATPAAYVLAEVAKVAVWVVTAWLCRAVARRPGIDPAAHRFWRTAAASGLLIAAANLIRLAAAPGRRAPEPAELASSLLVAAGVALIFWALLVQPLRMPRRARIRLRLDVATVMCAFVMLAWYFCLPGGGPPGNSAQLGVTVLASAMTLTATFAVVKLLLSGSAPFTPPAGAALGAGGVVGAWAILHMLEVGGGDAGLVHAAQLTSGFLIAAAARLQDLGMCSCPSGLTARNRPAYSRLPYAAVGVAQVLLVAALWREGLTMRGWGVVVGAVAIAALVMIRQNLAFADNADLVRRLDASLLDLRRQEQRFRSLVQHSSDLTLLVDASGTVRYASPALADILGADPDRAAGRLLTEVLRPEDAPAVGRLLADALAEPDDDTRRQLAARHADGGVRWIEALATNCLDDPATDGIILNIRDVTDARTLEDRLRHQATHDHLTGLPNRVLLNQRADDFRQDPDRPARHEAVLLLDLDDFKAVNDEHGHQVGDLLLVAVADRLRRSVRPSDTVARLGGDEFVVLLAGTTVDGAVATARRIVEALAEPAVVDGHALRAGASIGVAVGSGEQFDTLMRDADLAMYQAKRDGSRLHTVDRTGARTLSPSALGALP